MPSPLMLLGIAFSHHLLVEFPDARLRQGFDEDNPIRDAVAGNSALFDKALKMGPDLLFADLLAGLCNQEPERRSIHFGSGMLITAASATPGCLRIKSSICSEEIHSQPLLIMSFRRSVILT